MTDSAATSPVAVPAADAADILSTLALYAHVIDNRAWDRLSDVFTPDFSFGVGAGARGAADLPQLIESVDPYHPHYTSDTVLHRNEDGTVRAWSKYVIVRTDGSIASGDYLDTFVRAAGGWRIRTRLVSRGRRPPSDPGGPSQREFTVADWAGAEA